MKTVKQLTAATVFAVLLSGGATDCRATSSGPMTLRLLGFQPSSGKLFLTTDGPDAEGRQLQYIKLNAKAPRFYPAKRWTGLEPGEFARQAKKLKQLLKALQRLPLKGTTLSKKGVRRRRCRHRELIDYYPVCRWRTLELRAGKWRARFEVIVFGKPHKIRLLRLFSIPGTDLRVGVIRYRGIPVEGGYWRESAIIIRMHKMRATPKPTQTCCRLLWDQG